MSNANQTRAMTVPERQEQNLRSVVDMVAKKRDQLAMLLSDGTDPERFITVALSALQGQPKLLDCTPMSIFAAIREAAIYGLELGPLGDASLVPYGNEATLAVEYRGYRKLAMRDGSVRVIAADVVYENDQFRIVSGSENPGIYHEPALSERGSFLGAYAWARLTNGELVFVWMTELELLKRRSASRNKATWDAWPVEFRRKTVIKRLASEQLPLTPLLREVMTRDTDADLSRPEDRATVTPGQLQGADARQRILAAMGVAAPAIAPGEKPPETDGSAGVMPEGSTEGGTVWAGDQDDEAAEAFAAAGATVVQEAPSGRDSAPDAPEPPTALCSSPSPYEDVPEPCTKPLGHRLVCGNGKATWDRPIR